MHKWKRTVIRFLFLDGICLDYTACLLCGTVDSELSFTLFKQKFFFPLESGALQDVLHLHDVLARISLARLCHTLSRARALDGK